MLSLFAYESVFREGGEKTEYGIICVALNTPAVWYGNLESLVHVCVFVLTHMLEMQVLSGVNKEQVG